LLFGSIISATDPVAVVALLKDLGASKRLATIIEGESLLNDGTAMVVFLVMLDIVEGKPTDGLAITIKFIRLAVGGVLFGLFFGIILTLCLSRINKKPVLETNLTITFAYLTFYLAETHTIHVSGILALVSLGIYTSHFGKPRLDKHSSHAIHTTWSYIGFCAETIIFMLAGLIMAKAAHEREDVWTDIFKTIGLYALLHLIRFICLFVSLPVMRKMGYPMNLSHVALLSYSGLRGAVGLTLCLLVMKSPNVPDQVSDLILFHCSCIVLMTLLINGTTTGLVIEALGLATQSLIEKKNMCDFVHDFKENKHKVIKEMQEEKNWMKGVQWDKLEEESLVPTIEKYYQQNKTINVSRSQTMPHSGLKNLNSIILTDGGDFAANIRYQYLISVKAGYLKNADAGLMYPETLVLLEEACKIDIDLSH